MVLPQPPGEEFSNGERIDGRPWLRPETQQLMLQWEIAPRDVHRGVDATRIAFERKASARSDALPFNLGGTAKPQDQESLVDGDRYLTQQLRQSAGRGTPVQLHLPHAIAGLEVSDRPPRILV
jgi:hypothetical protein